MGEYFIEIKETAKKDFIKIYKSGNKSTINKLEKIVKELAVHPFTGSGSPEQLKHQLAGYWSRRLNRKDRLIYEVVEEPERIVVLISALGHY